MRSGTALLLMAGRAFLAATFRFPLIALLLRLTLGSCPAPLSITGSNAEGSFGRREANRAADRDVRDVRGAGTAEDRPGRAGAEVAVLRGCRLRPSRLCSPGWRPPTSPTASHAGTAAHAAQIHVRSSSSIGVSQLHNSTAIAWSPGAGLRLSPVARSWSSLCVHG